MYELFEGEKTINIKGYEGSYAVTDNGRVWSVRRNKWLAPFATDTGYMTVRLCLNNKSIDRTIHRLVGEAFVSNPENKPQINHINGDKRDNRASNLEWVTARENLQHACDLGLNSHFKLSGHDKKIICQIYERCDVTMAYLADIYDMSTPGIHYIIKAYGNQVGHA